MDDYVGIDLFNIVFLNHLENFIKELQIFVRFVVRCPCDTESHQSDQQDSNQRYRQ